MGALIALHHRERTGEGQLVDVAMMDTIFSMLENAIPNYTMDGVIPTRNGNEDASIAPFDVFACKDGYVTIGVGNDPMWARLCRVLGREDLVEDPRYLTNIDRDCTH